ncbi:hypothetical protein DSO57_1039450 [Entomophthora muscae]|uniref:Uncharacterized protein n=1 Tax=Entomophthora muscae TaxID=34485 RepID=A0ACC2UJ97_9FUNG|nr:hypothetical protein DSO57_1039450 [Entomophthora muscae]
MSGYDRRIKAMIKPKKGKSEHIGQAVSQAPRASESASQARLTSMRKNIYALLAPYATLKVHDPIELSEEVEAMLGPETENTDDVLLSSCRSSDFSSGTISDLTSPEREQNDRNEFADPRPAANDLDEQLDFKPSPKPRSLLVTLVLPESPDPQMNSRPKATSGSRRKASNEEDSPGFTSTNDAHEDLTNQPKRFKPALGSRNTESRTSEKDSVYNRDGSQQSRHYMSFSDKDKSLNAQRLTEDKPRTLVREPSRLSQTQRLNSAEGSRGPVTASRLQESAHRKPALGTSGPKVDVHPPKTHSETNDLLFEGNRPNSRSQDQRIRSALPKETAVDLTIKQSTNTSRVNSNAEFEFTRPKTPTSQNPPVRDPPRTFAAACKEAASHTLPMVPKNSEDSILHRPNTYITPIVVAGMPLPDPIVAPLPGGWSQTDPSQKYTETLQAHFNTYFCNAKEVWKIAKILTPKRTRKDIGVHMEVFLESFLWYCKAFHYQELLGTTAHNDMINLYASLLPTIKWWFETNKEIPNTAPIYGVAYYIKAFLCNRIAGLMNQLTLVSPQAAGFAEKRFRVQYEANEAYMLGAQLLSGPCVQKAFPELYHHFEINAFAGFPPFRPPRHDSANLIYFGRYIINSWLKARGVDIPICHEDNLPALRLDFLDPYIDDSVSN